MDSAAADLEPPASADSPEHPGLPAKAFQGLPAKVSRGLQELQDFPVSAEVLATAASRRTVKMSMPISM